MENMNLRLGINPESENVEWFKINQNTFNFKNVNNAWGIKLVEYDEKEMTTIIPNEIKAAFKNLEDAKEYAEENYGSFIIVPCKINN